MMTSSRTTKTLALSLLVFSMPLAQAGITDMVSSAYNKTVSASSTAISFLPIAIIAAIVARGCFRTPDKDPSKFTEFVNNLMQGNFVAENPVGIIDDAIGHVEYKDSIKKQIIEEKGLVGFVSKHYKTLAAVCLFPVLFTAIKELAKKGIQSWPMLKLSDFYTVETNKALLEHSKETVNDVFKMAMPKYS